MSEFNNIAVLIRQARLKLNLSQNELSYRVGYKNGQFISNVERGLCSIPKKKMMDTATVLSIDVLSIRDAMIADFKAGLNSFIQKGLSSEEV